MGQGSQRLPGEAELAKYRAWSENPTEWHWAMISCDHDFGGKRAQCKKMARTGPDTALEILPPQAYCDKA